MTNVVVKNREDIAIKKQHKIGDIYLNETTKEIFILASSSATELCLISLEDGNRYVDAVSVIDPFKLKDYEWDEISSRNNFVLLNSVTISVNN